jgi:dephospho-CoA kinase
MNVAEIKDFIKQYGIGLTGGIATGKTTVAGLIRALGYVVIDADELAKKASKEGSKGLALIVAEFGDRILQPDGSLNRKKLSALVFADISARKRLEQILHPLIAGELEKLIVELNLVSKKRYFFYEATLLFETASHERFREIWATVCAPATQLGRLRSRQNMDPELAAKIIAAQMPADAKAKRANTLIDTDCDLAELKLRVHAAVKTLN